MTMNMDVVADSQLRVGGGLRAVISGVSYRDIVRAFGRPNSTQIDTYKQDVEWLLSTPDGGAALYNWKPDLPGVPVEEVTIWHVGGEVDSVVPHVLRAFGPDVELNYQVPSRRPRT